jgi:DNA polymerase-1
MTLHVHQVLWPQLQAEPRLREVYERIELPVAASCSASSAMAC